MRRGGGCSGSAPVDNVLMPPPPSTAVELTAFAPSRITAALAPWPWSVTLLRGGLLAMLLQWVVERMAPAQARPALAVAVWAGLALLVSLRWAAALPDQLSRSREALAAGRSRTTALRLLLAPAELTGLLHLAGLTIAGCLAWLMRRSPPAGNAGVVIEDRRKGFYEALFLLNIVSMVVEIPVSLLVLSSLPQPLLHVAVHATEVLLIVWMLGDRWQVRAGGHVLTPTHLQLRAGVRASANLPLHAIAAVEVLDKRTRLRTWAQAHGVGRWEAGTVSVLDKPNVAILIRPDASSTWTRLQVKRPLPRCLFVYVDDPRELQRLVTVAHETAARSATAPGSSGPHLTCQAR